MLVVGKRKKKRKKKKKKRKKKKAEKEKKRKNDLRNVACDCRAYNGEKANEQHSLR